MSVTQLANQIQRREKCAIRSEKRLLVQEVYRITQCETAQLVSICWRNLSTAYHNTAMTKYSINGKIRYRKCNAKYIVWNGPSCGDHGWWSVPWTTY